MVASHYRCINTITQVTKGVATTIQIWFPILAKKSYTVLLLLHLCRWGHSEEGGRQSHLHVTVKNLSLLTPLHRDYIQELGARYPPLLKKSTPCIIWTKRGSDHAAAAALGVRPQAYNLSTRVLPPENTQTGPFFPLGSPQPQLHGIPCNASAQKHQTRSPDHANSWCAVALHSRRRDAARHQID